MQVVREIKARHMEPVLTLQHMTLPHWVLTPSNVNQTLARAAAKSTATTALAVAAIATCGALGALGALRLVLCGFAMTLHGDVMTGRELERDVPARLDRLPDGLPFG